MVLGSLVADFAGLTRVKPAGARKARKLPAKWLDELTEKASSRDFAASCSLPFDGYMVRPWMPPSWLDSQTIGPCKPRARCARYLQEKTTVAFG